MVILGLDREMGIESSEKDLIHAIMMATKQPLLVEIHIISLILKWIRACNVVRLQGILNNYISTLLFFILWENSLFGL